MVKKMNLKPAPRLDDWNLCFFEIALDTAGVAVDQREDLAATKMDLTKSRLMLAMNQFITVHTKVRSD